MADNRDRDALLGVVLDDALSLSLRELCHSCGVSAEQVLAMVEEGVVEPYGAEPRVWRFPGASIRRVQIALRLQRDLQVNLAGAALALELLDELEALRRWRADPWG